MVAPNPSYIRQAAPVELLNRSGRVVARIECSQCGAHDEWTIAGGTPPPEMLPKHFTQKGWNLRKRPICPLCNSPQKKENTMSNVAPITPDITPTPSARAARAEAVTAIVSYFNVAEGRYDDGWSDARIAKETGLPEDWVAKRRNEDFGPIKEPKEFAELRAEAKSLASEIGKLQAKLEAMVKRNQWSG